ncbi:hypothetical protein MNBD_GAMMA22-2451 [hydrothermal vent metagenome]|uniref:histidine kinase n=1 Tax=hydrothermal vent metagenome TaxID=652676 RepID=A0A3B1A9N2_9ZZZZ
MLSVVISLLLMSSAVIISERYLGKKLMTERLLTVNRIIADRSTAALVFDDKIAAKQNLQALDNESSVLLACIYGKEQLLFSSYIKDNVKNNCPNKAPEKGHKVIDNNFEASQKIILDGEEIGTVYILASNKALYQREINFVLIILVIVLVASTISYLLAIKLQTLISQPILELANIVRLISNNENYSTFMPKVTNDEIGVLNKSFKNMMEQIKKRELSRDEAEQELIKKEKDLDITLHSIADAVITTNAQGMITRMNLVAEHLTGWSFVSARNKNIKLVFNIIDSNSKELIKNPIEKVLTSGEVSYIEKNTILVSKNGISYQIADSGSAAPIKDENGTIQGVILVFSDATSQLQTEKALRRSQKMEAIGQLSGGIAHDFNNRLGIIIGYLDILKNYVENDEKPSKWVNTAIKATLRCSDLTQQLLGFSRQNTEKKVVVNVKNEFKDLENMIARSLTPGIKFVISIVEDLWLVETDPGELHDAILNLAINARDAMPDGGQFLIEANNSYLDTEYTHLNPEILTGDYLQIVLSDTGKGMNKETIEHIFEPFYTTKSKASGTGLGMAMVYGFAKRYGGHIKIYSELNVGTTIRIFLPRSKDSIEVSEVNNITVDKLPTGNESILIVDDEFDLLQLAAQYISDLNYTFYTAENAEQALIILKGNLTIDLLFSDIVMPGGINGYELANLALELKPDIKVLLTSGFTSQSMLNNNKSHFAKNLLSKPYRKIELAQRLRKVLDGSKTSTVSGLTTLYTVLIVNDRPNIRALYKIKLINLGFKTILANDGYEALNIYKQYKKNNKTIDVIIIDLSPENGLSNEQVKENILSQGNSLNIIVFLYNNSNTQFTVFNLHATGAKALYEEDIKHVLESTSR